MKIELISIRLDRPLSDSEVRRLLKVVPPERRERLLRLKDPVLGHEPLCAYAALLLGLNALYGWQSLPPMCYNRYGKPYFPDHPDVRFNISHTHGAVLVGIHDEPLGVDIERIRPISERTIRQLSGAGSKEEFFHGWVQRESRSKWYGAGLASLREEAAAASPGERFLFFDTFPDYVACVCTHSDAELNRVKRFTLNELR